MRISDWSSDVCSSDLVTVGGTDLPEGAHLLILFASGNDDEAVFECPRHFDSKRENLGKSLTFGSGVHLCLVIALACMPLRVAARHTARKLKDLQLSILADDCRSVPKEGIGKA